MTAHLSANDTLRPPVCAAAQRVIVAAEENSALAQVGAG
jgi:hypothetical protein